MDRGARRALETLLGKIARSAYGLLCRAALQLHGEHPKVTIRSDDLLRSINARLGALVATQGTPDPGEEFEPLGTDWLSELLTFAMANKEDLEADLEERLAEVRSRG